MDQGCKLEEKLKIRRGGKTNNLFLESFGLDLETLKLLSCVNIVKFKRNSLIKSGISNMLFIGNKDEKLLGFYYKEYEIPIIASSENSLLGCWATMSHELRHFAQLYDPMSVPHNINYLWFYLDSFVQKFGFDKNYYDSNYWNISFEIDARTTENEEVLGLLDKLSSEVKDANYEEYSRRLEKEKQKYCSPFYNSERSYEGRKMHLYEVFSIVLSELRKIAFDKEKIKLELKKNFPILFYIIHDDLTLKSINELREELKCVSDEELILLYNSFIENYPSGLSANIKQEVRRNR